MANLGYPIAKIKKPDATAAAALRDRFYDVRSILSHLGEKRVTKLMNGVTDVELEDIDAAFSDVDSAALLLTKLGHIIRMPDAEMQLNVSLWQTSTEQIAALWEETRDYWLTQSPDVTRIKIKRLQDRLMRVLVAYMCATVLKELLPDKVTLSLKRPVVRILGSDILHNRLTAIKS